MRLSVHSFYDEAFRELGSITEPNNRKYCERHGYAYDCGRKADVGERPPAWQKIKALQAGHGSSDWMFWIDADAAFINHEIELAKFIPDDPNVHMLVGQDVNGINTGGFFLDSSDWSKAFLEKVWGCEQDIHSFTWEQAAIRRLLKSSEWAKHVKVGAYEPWNVVYAASKAFGPNDLVLHAAGKPMDLRLGVMRGMVK